jgi:hypothetical protein
VQNRELFTGPRRDGRSRNFNKFCPLELELVRPYRPFFP